MLTSREDGEKGTVLEIVIIIFAPVVIVVVVRRARFLLDDLDGPPFARRVRHRLHHRRECSTTELVRRVVERVDDR